MRRPIAIFWIVLGAGLLAKILYVWAGIIDLAPDEAYYWQWSRQLDWSYYSKGPLVAVFIRLGTWIAGATPFGVRLPMIALFALTAYLSLRLYQRLFPNRQRGLILIAALLHSAPLLVVGGLLATIDPLLCAAWMFGLLALHAAVRDARPWAWAGVSLSLGLGVLAKYTMLLFVPVVPLYLALSPRNRSWLRRPAPYLALAGGLLFLAPLLLWNASHHWASVRHTAELGNLVGESQARGSLLNLPRMILLQAGVVSPILFVLLALGMWRLVRETRGDRGRDGALLLLGAIAPVLLFYSLVSLREPVNANWPVAIYPPAILGACAFWEGRLHRRAVRRAFASGVGLGLLVTGLVLFSDLFHVVGFPGAGRLDPAARLKGWPEFAALAEQASAGLPPGQPFFYFSDRYQTASELAFYVTGRPRTFSVPRGRLSNQYDVWGGSEDLLGRNAVFAQRAKNEEDLLLPDDVRQAFRRVEPDARGPYVRHGSVLRWDATWRCYDFQGWPAPAGYQEYE